jgi:hypothetical protein
MTRACYEISTSQQNIVIDTLLSSTNTCNCHVIETEIHTIMSTIIVTTYPYKIDRHHCASVKDSGNIMLLVYIILLVWQ